MGQRSYTTEFKEEVIKYLKEHPELTLASIARKFELAESTLRDWRNASEEYKSEAFVGSGNLRTPDAELRAMQR